MEFDNFSRANNNRFNNLEVSHSWPLLMRKVYTWMAMALTITGVVAYGVSTSTAMLMKASQYVQRDRKRYQALPNYKLIVVPYCYKASLT